VKSEQFLNHTLRIHPHGESITRILAAAIDSVEPGLAVRRFLSFDGKSLTVSGKSFDIQGRVFALGIGKAAVAMTDSVAEILGTRLERGLVVTKHIPESASSGLEIIEGGHPVPDERSLAAGERVEGFIKQLKADDLLICLISGGGSALVTAPRERISLEDIQTLTTALLECGARIDEINTLRRQLDRLKGGGLAGMAYPTQVISLILSDVVGNPLEAIASGPTALDSTSSVDALNILHHYDLINNTPAVIVSVLKQAPAERKTEIESLGHVLNVIVGSNLIAAQAALRQAADEGFHPYLLRTDLQGEAREIAWDLSIQLRWAWRVGDPVPRPACIVAGGESTVTVHGEGRGGRNTELALAAVSELADFPEVMLVTLATDGEDGSTDSAGAVVSGETWRRGIELDLNAVEFLNRNDSYSYFNRLDDLLRPGPTGTNVNDLIFLFTFQ
jgi:hydroxypyruvate reductase